MESESFKTLMTVLSDTGPGVLRIDDFYRDLWLICIDYVYVILTYKKRTTLLYKRSVLWDCLFLQHKIFRSCIKSYIYHFRTIKTLVTLIQLTQDFDNEHIKLTYSDKIISILNVSFFTCLNWFDKLLKTIYIWRYINISLVLNFVKVVVSLRMV